MACESTRWRRVRVQRHDRRHARSTRDPGADEGTYLIKDLGKPIDVANCVLFLASDEARFVTGAVVLSGHRAGEGHQGRVDHIMKTLPDGQQVIPDGLA